MAKESEGTERKEYFPPRVVHTESCGWTWR